eukprot:113226-Prorocentrum_minimum.AAC.1
MLVTNDSEIQAIPGAKPCLWQAGVKVPCQRVGRGWGEHHLLPTRSAMMASVMCLPRRCSCLPSSWAAWSRLPLRPPHTHTSSVGLDRARLCGE